MNILIAIDKFKNSLNSFEVAEAIRKGFLQASSNFSVAALPLSDGGDGLTDAIAYYTNASKHTLTVADPLFRSIEASYLLSADGKTAFIEMAKASGLLLLQPSEYNCMITSTYGTGQLIKAALLQKVDKIILGIGGSATNDCGIGMATALGYRFLDKEGKELQPIGANLIHIHTIDSSNKLAKGKIEIKVACDVTNYLTGEEGAAKVYAPQKGANPDMVAQLEAGALHFAEVVKKDLGIDISTIEGGGAAGGMGAGCVAFLDAALVKGIDLVLEISKAEDHIQKADCIITGEGKIDSQTLSGKLVAGVAELAKKHNKPVIAVCGNLDVDKESLHHIGITAAFSIINKPMPLEEAYIRAAELLTETSFNIGKLLLVSLAK